MSFSTLHFTQCTVLFPQKQLNRDMVKKLMKETSDNKFEYVLGHFFVEHTSRFHADQEQRGCLKVKKMAKGCCGHVLIWRETKPFLLFSCGLAIIPKCTFPRLLQAHYPAGNNVKPVVVFQEEIFKSVGETWIEKFSLYGFLLFQNLLLMILGFWVILRIWRLWNIVGKLSDFNMDQRQITLRIVGYHFST